MSKFTEEEWVAQYALIFGPYDYVVWKDGEEEFVREMAADLGIDVRTGCGPVCNLVTRRFGYVYNGEHKPPGDVWDAS